MKTAVWTAVALLALASPSTAIEFERQGYQASTVAYVCERDVRFDVVYINTDEGLSLAMVPIEGKLVAMEIARSGSGARYIALDEQDSYRWWTKGDTGFLTWLAADHTAEEVTLYADCKAQDEGGL